MSRRRRRAADHRPVASVSGPEQEVEKRGERWAFRSIPGQSAVKVYTCPRCLADIPVGAAHIVAWPADDPDGVAERRHWHTACWHRFR